MLFKPFSKGDRRRHATGKPHLTFGPFRLDMTQGQLWRGAQVLALRRRSLAMLRYLAEHPGRLVTKAELRQHVWGGTHVTDTVLPRVCVQEIRAVLGDAADAPHYLATVGRQGYRFLVGDDGRSPPTAGRPLVGRQREVDTLASWFQRATQGTRQVVSVSGEAGMGKTTLVEQWLARLATGRGCGLHGASASSTLARGNRTCHSWRRWGNSAVGRVTGRCWTHCSGMRRCGSSNGRGCCPKRSCSASSASSRGRPRPGCSRELADGVCKSAHAPLSIS